MRPGCRLRIWRKTQMSGRISEEGCVRLNAEGEVMRLHCRLVDESKYDVVPPDRSLARGDHTYCGHAIGQCCGGLCSPPWWLWTADRAHSGTGQDICRPAHLPRGRARRRGHRSYRRLTIHVPRTPVRAICQTLDGTHGWGELLFGIS